MNESLEREAIPWEQRSKLGFVAGFLRTWWLVMSGPRAFYRRMRPDAELVSPLIYAALVLSANHLPALVSELINVIRSENRDSASMWTPVGWRLGVPLLGTWVIVATVHFGCLAWRVHPHGFRGTVRVFSYAVSPTLLCSLLWAACFITAHPLLSVVSWGLVVLQGLLIVFGLVYACGARPSRVILGLLFGPVQVVSCFFIAFYNYFSRTPG